MYICLFHGQFTEQMIGKSSHHDTKCKCKNVTFWAYNVAVEPLE